MDYDTLLNKRYKYIKNRCEGNYPSNFNYTRYGERGIKLEWITYQEFKNDMFNSFVEHIKRYGLKNTSIDRINNNGNYSKENCRWATRQIQANNKSNNRKFSINGITKSMSEWILIYKIPSQTVYARIKKGMTVLEAFTKEIDPKKQNFKGIKYNTNKNK